MNLNEKQIILHFIKELNIEEEKCRNKILDLFNDPYLDQILKEFKINVSEKFDSVWDEIDALEKENLKKHIIADFT